jgi:hypothetical protein
MMDYAKGHVLELHLIQKIKYSPFLKFVEDRDYLIPKTGEVKQKEIRSYKNMVFTFFPNRLEITGSFHVLKNNGHHNADDFTVDDCINTIISFCEKFEIPPRFFILTGIEFGLNLKLKTPVNELLAALRFYKKNEFIRHRRLKNVFYSGSNYFELKAYNKSEQHPSIAISNLFRFEWKTNEAKYLKAHNCHTLQDLLNPDIYRQFSKILLKSWDDALVFDETKRKGKKFHHTEYWKDTIASKSENTFNNRKKNYYKVIGNKNVHSEIYLQMNQKIQELTDYGFSTVLYIPKYIIV